MKYVAYRERVRKEKKREERRQKRREKARKWIKKQHTCCSTTPSAKLSLYGSGNDAGAGGAGYRF